MAGSRQKRLTEFDPRREVAIDRRRLPHWRQLGVSYFVTFRLADSLPLDPLRQWRQDRNVWLKWHPPPLTKSELEEYEQRFSSRIQEWLDAGMGACYLRRSDIRSVVESCLLRFDGTRYGIYAFVIMPNHVHALITPHDGYDLSNVLKAIKGVSANRCNKLLGRKGDFWMDESYDHIVRDHAELQIFRDYIADNPKKARLKEGEYSLLLRNSLDS